MDPRDRLRARLASSICAACGAPSRPERIRLLARREGLVFVRVGCHACGSDALAILSLVDDQLGEATASGEDVDATGGPFTDQDVVAVRDMLRTFQGDVRMLFRDAAGRSRQEHEE